MTIDTDAPDNNIPTPEPEKPKGKTRAKTERKTPAGCWIAAKQDGTGAVPFSSELAALRHAMSAGLTVAHVPYGTPVAEVIK